MVWSLALVFPHLYRTGTNVVTRTYHFAAQNLVQGLSPYGFLGENTDVFKYSPLFAYLYFPLTLLPSSWEAIVFATLNCLIFWFGFFLWAGNAPRRWGIIFCGAVLASMELDGSLRYQQVNAALVGGILFGVWAFKEFYEKTSGKVLALVANFKILPLVFAGSLFFARKKKYIVSFFISSAVAVLVPTLFLGFEKSLEFHLQWLEILWRDGQVPIGILDLRSSLVRGGVDSRIAQILRIGVSLVSVFGLIWCGFQVKNHIKNKRNVDFELWLSLGLCFVLLVSPRTESPTFVLMAPVYFFLLKWIWNERFGNRFLFILRMSLFLSGAFWVSVSFNDLWPKSLWNPLDSNAITKSFGLWILWFLAAEGLSRRKFLPQPK